MSDLQLNEIYLLRCEFAVRAVEASASEAAPVDPLSLTARQDRSDGTPFLLLDGDVASPDLPFSLSFTMIAWFQHDQTGIHDDEVRLRQTMTFMVFPYVREFISDMTNRAPSGALHVPPRTAVPQRLAGDA